jgi:hypothetical protein
MIYLNFKYFCHYHFNNFNNFNISLSHKIYHYFYIDLIIVTDNNFVYYCYDFYYYSNDFVNF